MLKFADLNVDVKSFDNTFDLFLKLFPNSYTPLLVMYLANEGKLKLVDEFDKNDTHVLVSADGNIIDEFLGNSIFELLQDEDSIFQPFKNIIDKDKFDKEEFTKAILLSLTKDRDFDVMTSLFIMFFRRNPNKSVALIADIKEDETIEDLIRILSHNDRATDNPAALMYFYIMLMNKYQKFESSEEDKSDIDYDDKYVMSHWTEDFDNLLYKINSYSNVSIQPSALTRVILSQWDGGTVYNPFAGMASYSVQLKVELGFSHFYNSKFSLGDLYYGEEINETIWAVGKLRLLAYHTDSENYNFDDSTTWRRGIANYVFSTPPFGLRFENENGEQEYADTFVIRRGLQSISDDGLIGCVVPLSFLYRKDSEQVRKEIIDNRWLESIVYLPDRLFDNTDIYTVIIFIRKTEHKDVLFIDARKAVHDKNSRRNFLDDEIVANLLYHKSYPRSFEFKYDCGNRMEDELPEDLFYSMKTYADYTTIAEYGYDLTLGRYFIDSQTAPVGFRNIPLKDIVTGFPETVGSDGEGKIVNSSLLSKDAFTPLLSTNIAVGKFKRHFKVVDRDAILFSLILSTRPTLFKCTEGDKVYIDPYTMGAVYLSSSSVIPEYVLIELIKPYAQNQIQLLSKGNNMSRIYMEDFLQVCIQIPDSHIKALLLEKEAYDSAKEVYYNEIYNELVAQKEKQHLDYVKMLRQRKHRIQQIMNEFAPAFSSLNSLREKNGGTLRDNDVVASRTGETVANYFEKLQFLVKNIEELITNLVDNERFEKSSIVDMINFIYSIPKKHISNRYDFEILDKREPDAFENDEPVPMENPLVEIGINELSTVFDNIIANAAKWGFTEGNRNDYRIKIELFSDRLEGNEAVKICISNNGTPIHESVDRERFFEWGYGSGSGIGTWQLRNIIEHYGGQIKLNEYPDDRTGYQTEYEIILPLENVD